MQEKIKKKYTRYKILVAPLDWGLGHATRCIPIIESLLSNDNEVIIGAKGQVATILKEAFPQIQIIPLKGYGVRYSKSKHFFFLKMITQLPKIKAAIDFERNWLQQVIDSHQIDVVISDNRLGLYNKAIQSVIITHQLGIQSGNLWLDRLIQKVNYHFINQFSECWIPDFEGENNIAGELSHPHIMPKIPVDYIGTLSRFTKTPQEKKYKKVIVLSGPEPQRTILENILIVQLKNYPETAVLVRGLPNDSTVLKIDNPLIVIHNHLESKALSILMQQADCVIARSGYSTIMDLLAIEQPALLIPTPGQTEQLYLAKYLSEKKLFKSVNQEELKL